MTNISTQPGVNTGGAAGHAAAADGSPVREAAALAEETTRLVRHWLTEAAKVPVDASAEQLAGVLKDPNGLDFTVGFVDGVVRPEDLQVAARNLAALAPKVPAFLPWHMRSAVRLGGTMAPALPQVVIPIARRVLREMVGHLIVDATDATSSSRSGTPTGPPFPGTSETRHNRRSSEVYDPAVRRSPQEFASLPASGRPRPCASGPSRSATGAHRWSGWSWPSGVRGPAAPSQHCTRLQSVRWRRSAGDREAEPP